ncbi:MAG: phosphotransferase [Deltaproteobacteria bacterium]|nr:phosphotransferase [Deltaproteobacteria bacterium]MBW2121068.1 phosphotransferase [Deltaproteobacteria bacterium]
MPGETDAGVFQEFMEGRTSVLAEVRFLKSIHNRGFRKVGEVLEKAWIDPTRCGRGNLRLFSVSGRADRRFVVRHYTHGGILRRVLGDRFLQKSRPFVETITTEKIRTLGIPTARVVAALTYPSRGPFYRGELITEEIPGALDLVSLLSNMRRAPFQKRAGLWREAVKRAGRAVRLMHDRGVYHGDLNLKNILVRNPYGSCPEIYIIDFDRSKIQDSLSTEERMKNLLRLDRSAEKWKTRGIPISNSDKARFFRAYAKGDPDLLRAMRRHLKKARLLRYWYRLGWAADRLFNPSTPSSLDT